MSWLRDGVLVLLVAATVLLGWTSVSEPFVQGSHGLNVMRAAISVLLLLGSVWGAGSLLPDRDRPGATWLHQLVLGGVILSALCGGLAWLGLMAPLPLGVLASVLTAVGMRDPPRPALGSSGVIVALVALACLLPLLPLALAPPTDTDELYWQLAIPAQMLREGGFPGGWLQPVASRPLSAQLIYTALLSGGGELAPRMAHLAGTLLFVLGIFDVARRLWGPRAAMVAALMAVGNWTLLDEAPLAHDNMPAAFMVLAALDAALNRRPWRWAIASGAALAIKYTAAPAVLAVGVLAVAYRAGASRDPRRWARTVARYGALGLLALALVSPWWLRNVVDGLHPFFPYAGWPELGGFVYAYPAKYGAGQGLGAWLSLPWTLIMYAETGSFVFLGRAHALWLLFLPMVGWAAWSSRDARWMLLASILGISAWFALGAQWMRHLVPLLPVLALTVAAAFSVVPNRVHGVLAVAWLLLLPPQTHDRWAAAGDALLVAQGDESRADYYARKHKGYATADFVNRTLPADAVVALLFTGESYLYQRTVRVGSVEDHTPSRLLMVQHGEAALAHLRERGVTHVVARRVNLLHKSYPFLSQAQFEDQFLAPQALLRQRLPLEATLVFEHGRYGVWALP